MEDDNELRGQFIKQLAELGRRIADLETSEIERRRAVEALHESQEQLRLITDTLPVIISYVDSEQRYRFNNRAYEEWFELSGVNLFGKHIREVLGEEGYEEIRSFVESALSGSRVSHERVVPFRDGGKRYINAIYVPHIDAAGEVKGFFSLGIDVTERSLAEEALRKAHDELERRVEDRTGELRAANEQLRLEIEERKRTEEKLRYMSIRDSLTGLFNRTFFEEEMNRLEAGRATGIGILLCDVDGLKLVNDSLGHDTGDKLLIAAANVVRECSRAEDTVARIGGDEFAMLFHNTDKAAVENVAQRIRKAAVKYNEANPDLPLSISIGLAFRHRASIRMLDLFREADNNMYREKLLSIRSARNVIIQTLMRALEARDFVTEGHLNRLQEMVTHLAAVIGLPESGISDLRLLAQFHDIGKVGIPDRILFKPEALSPDEVEEMRLHCEIGYRIALASPDLTNIADWILKHHEWWNGHGYPLGLKREEIPLECRILAIADAYDAMTSTRPYRKAISRKEAVSELRRCADMQFDPQLVSKFAPILSRAKVETHR